MTAADFPAVLRLNEADVSATGPLDHAALARLIAAARDALVAAPAGTVEAFLVTFDESGDYDSPNFRWFKARHARFVYVDRIVVDGAARGRGHARRLYEAMFAAARETGHDLVGCEVNLDPPNPVSDAFHAALGFKEAGRARLPAGTKTVRYYTKAI